MWIFVKCYARKLTNDSITFDNREKKTVPIKALPLQIIKTASKSLSLSIILQSLPSQILRVTARAFRECVSVRSHFSRDSRRCKYAA